MEARMQLGNYLVAYLRRIGLTHLFGIPGDLVIQLFMKFGQPHDIRVITSSQSHHQPYRAGQPDRADAPASVSAKDECP